MNTITTIAAAAGLFIVGVPMMIAILVAMLSGEH